MKKSKNKIKTARPPRRYDHRWMARLRRRLQRIRGNKLGTGLIRPEGPSESNNFNNFGAETKKMERINRSQIFSPQSTLWIHMWSGLVSDPSGKHRTAIGKAIWLYLYLLVVANWKTGTLFRRLSTIAAEMGSNGRTVSRWLATLKKHGYVETKRTGRALTISISKWRPITRKWRDRSDRRPPD